MNSNGFRITKKISDRLINLIDIIFGVVVAHSFMIIFVANQSNSKLQLNSYLLLFLAYTAIVLSWMGYHKMMVYNFYKQNKYGYLRFSLDILLVFLYAVLLYSYDNSIRFFSILPIIFFIYTIGGILRNKEYNNNVSWPKGSLMFTGLFTINFLIYYIWTHLKINYNIFLFNVICGLTFIYLIWYRWKREKKGFKK